MHWFAADWSPAERAEIAGELDARGVAHRFDGEDLYVAREHERMVDMLVESVTEE